MSAIVEILEQAKVQIRNEDLSGALERVKNCDPIAEQGDYFLLGEFYYGLQAWGDAMNSFQNHLRTFEKDEKAIGYLKMIQSILNFYHKDLYNP